MDFFIVAILESLELQNMLCTKRGSRPLRSLLPALSRLHDSWGMSLSSEFSKMNYFSTNFNTEYIIKVYFWHQTKTNSRYILPIFQLYPESILISGEKTILSTFLLLPMLLRFKQIASSSSLKYSQVA